MAGKSNKNPLLSGAGISFPFENFTSNTLLVPVPQQEPSLIPEDIEADSFLGQNTHKSTVSNVQPTAVTGHSDFSSNIWTLNPSDSRKLLPNVNPIPVFTESFTGITCPTKPTPLYADSLLHLTSSTPPSLILNPSQNSSTPCPALTQPTNPPSISTSNPVSSYFSIPSSVSIPQPSHPPNILTPFTSTNTSPNSDLNTHPSHPPSILTPQPSNSSSPIPTSIHYPSHPPSIITPFTSKQSSPSPVRISHPNYPPSSFQPFTSENSTPSPAPLPLPSVFTPTSSIQNLPYSTHSEHHSSPPPSNFTPISHNSTSGASHSAQSQSHFNYNAMPAGSPGPVIQQSVPPAATGIQVNSYRLGNIKHPQYTRPAELPAALRVEVPSPMTPAQTNAAVFTPCSVDSLGSESVPIDTNIRPPPIVAFNFSNQTPPQSQPTVLPPSIANLTLSATYRPVYHHWFFKKVVEGKVLWNPFSMADSLALEQAFTSATISPDTKVAADGGRYDVEVLRRRRYAVYWEEEPAEVRRCSWFFKGSMDIGYVPYEENVATMLEEEYRIASTSSEWNREVQLPDEEKIVIHSPNAIAHYTRSVSPEVWGNSPQMQQKPRVVKRGLDDFDISDGEPDRVDHLLFLVHGIGKFCDLKFRPVTEVVDDFRNVTLQLLQSHFKEAVEAGQVGRVEVLPVSWHQALHSEHIDQRLNNITLNSIPRLRHFTNDTLLDILFYTSPVFCETIVQAVGNEMNRLYNLFLSRNPGFCGGVSLGGHSLGSLILFDMLCNQTAKPAPPPTLAEDDNSSVSPKEQEHVEEELQQALGCMKASRARLSRRVSYVSLDDSGTGLPFISYPQLVFHPKAFFALGSPIGMFVTVRGIESLGKDFCLPTCPMFFNIFHPFDPVAYRVESLIDPQYSKYSPVLIPHHKGRKRMHLELKDTLEHVGTALKQKLVESVRMTWNTVYQLAMFHRPDSLEQEVNKVIENEIMQSCSSGSTSDSATDNNPEPNEQMGLLNRGNRIDYVLQEAPLESFNEYLFALSSHVCYWESEDTMLMMLKEIYNTIGVSPDSQVVQQILPFEDSVTAPNYLPLQTLSHSVGMDPTAPLSDNINIGPPPKLGFVRK